MLSKQEFLDEILKLNSNYDTELIGHAYDIGRTLHEGQMRKSGEPYFIHPIAVAIILAQLGMDDRTLVGGLLHDVVEDTQYTREQLVEDFDEEVALLVDGVTKLGAIKFENKEEQQAENFRKMFLAMSKDIRVLIIKLADRLHNMRTIQYMKPEKQIEKSRETLDIFAPLATRLGIYTVKFELEDIALKYLEPEAYEDLNKKLTEKRAANENIIQQVTAEIDDALKDMNIKYEIYGRNKQLYSVYKKMKYQNKQLDEIFDLTALRILVENVRDCYAILGIVHTMWFPIPGRFKDYIAMPKPNMYQSLHTTLIDDDGNPFEIQIRTYEMHHVAEYGIAAHWKYKEGRADEGANNDDLKLSWLRQSIEWQKDSDNSEEFLETMKMDLFSTQVFVFTPNGDVKELPAGSTPLDFAFKIHSDVGCKCVGAKVNGKMVTIDHTLQNGDIVEIVTSQNSSGPSPDWLKIAKSSSARNKIRQWLKKENKGDTIDQGKQALEAALKKKGFEPNVVLKNAYIAKALKASKFDTISEAYNQIAPGGSILSKFCNNLIAAYTEAQKVEPEKKDDEVVTETIRKTKKNLRKDPGIIVKGADNLLIRTSRCCSPVPGDDIVGFITKGRGISVHRKDCSNIKGLEERFIEVEWADIKQGVTYDADIVVVGRDRKGLFSDITKACSDMELDLNGVNGKTDKDGNATLIVTVSIDSTQQMQKVLKALRNIQDVDSVYRAKS
ncbi:MAG: bifunctional (p)ppGpp synthetase/guanosine-3',5'-bis(diphosphate) 3'-pyrophosphohydrolase [Clostridia bacterium]|nr:bifunctional (p)ppGpp synthetase/guanosine-3',5'-bis(diphosphate) 3'-pyrophosphohydrolase [Clostridia bacterium]